MARPAVTAYTDRLYDRLEEFRREADAEQPIPAHVSALPELLNIIRNPRPADLTGVTGYVGGASGETLELVTVNDHPAGITTAVRVTLTAGTGVKFAGDALGGARIGALWVRRVSGTAGIFQAAFHGVGAGDVLTLPAGEWVRATVAVDNAKTDNNLGVRATVGATGDVIEVAGVIAVAGTDVPDYFDGDTPDTGTTAVDRIVYEWTGTPHASASRRRARAEFIGSYPLLRYLSLLGDQAGEVEELLNRFDPELNGGTADLVDPATADAAWLPWLAQLVGARLSPLIAEAEQRVTIATAAAGFQAGSRDALAAVARRALTGTQYVNITPNLDGNPWVIGLATAQEDTPSIAAVVAAIEDAGAKPAGYRLEVTFYSASWDTLEARYPTSDDWDAVASWDALEQTRA